MIKKLLLFLGITSCRKERKEAIGLKNTLYRTVGISKYKYGGVYLQIEEHTNNEQGIRYDSLAVEVVPQLVCTGIALNNVGIIKSAYAMKLGEVFDKVAEIQVTSNKDYNDAYARGTNLLPILSAGYTNPAYSDYTTDKKPVMDLFKELNYDGCPLFFNVAPSNSEQHIFTITISTTDGKRLSTTTDEVFLRKS